MQSQRVAGGGCGRFGETVLPRRSKSRGRSILPCGRTFRENEYENENEDDSEDARYPLLTTRYRSCYLAKSLRRYGAVGLCLSLARPETGP
jgi:hypothetical protein